MAFISMGLVFLVIVAIFLGILLIAGLILLVIGIINRHRKKYIGKHSPTVCIVTGAVIFSLPLMLVIGITVLGTASALKTALNRESYESIPDRWRNEWVSDSQAADEILQALLSSADSGDREAFSKNFTPEVQRKNGFDQAVDAFFAAFPQGLSQCEMRDKGGGGSGSYDHGHHVKTYGTHCNCMLDGQWYYISVECCYSHTDEPDKVGVTDFKVMNLEAAAVFFDRFSRDTEYLSDVYLLCDVRSPEEVSARLIGGQPFLWMSSETPKLTADELRELLKQNKRLDAPELKKKLGEPNAFRKYVNSNAYEYYYELTDRNGEPCYAEIETDSPLGAIICAFLCTPDKTDYDAILWSEEDSGDTSAGS